MCVYVAAVYIGSVFILRQQLRRSCKIVCLYSAVNAAKSLEEGDLLKASYFTVKMAEFIKPFSEMEKVKIGHFTCKLRDVFLGDIDKIHEQGAGIGRAIIEQTDKSKDFSNNLYNLSLTLFSSHPVKLNEAISSLKFFIESSQGYFKPQTFLQNHKKMNVLTRTLAEAAKVSLVPALLFILWLVFGYKA